jgi:hypothetical protein
MDHGAGDFRMSALACGAVFGARRIRPKGLSGLFHLTRRDDALGSRRAASLRRNNLWQRKVFFDKGSDLSRLKRYFPWQTN